jgi:hypothetical protein
MHWGSQQRFHHSISGRSAARSKGPSARAVSSEQSAREMPELVLRLTHLLNAAPVDLALISEEIRSQPKLDALVLRLTASLLLSPESLVTTLEEAAVVLGTDRLRVIAYMWSIRSEECCRSNFDAPSQTNAGVSDVNDSKSLCCSPGPTPETLYLASFLQWLGLNAPNSASSGKQAPCFASGLQRGQFAELRNAMMRDFLALDPVLNHRF